MTLFDNNLKNILAQIGYQQQFLNKKAQEGISGEISQLAKSLIDSLEEELKIDTTFMAGSQQDKDVQPTPKDLESLDSLEKFLANNFIQVDGKRIVEGKQGEVKIKNVPGDKPGETKQIKTVTIDAPYTADKEAFKKYILRLRKDANASGDKLFILYVGKLIDQAKEKYKFTDSDFDLSKAEKEESIDTNEIFLDNIPVKINVPHPEAISSYEYKPLYVKNLLDKNAFTLWCSGTKPQIMINFTQGIKEALDPITDMNVCNFLNYLHDKANKIYGDEDRKKVYVTKILELVKKDYPSCSITGSSGIITDTKPSAPVTTTKETSKDDSAAGKTESSGGAGTGVTLGKEQIASLNEILNNPPLLEQAIDLNRILNFSQKMGTISTDLNNLHQQINALIASVNSSLSSPVVSLNNRNIKTFLNSLKSGKAQDAGRVLQGLNQIIDNVNTMLLSFKYTYLKYLEPEDFRSKIFNMIADQIGKDTYDASNIYKINKNILEDYFESFQKLTAPK